VIHVRRADGLRLDCVLHVNPELTDKAMAVVYNPSDVPQEEQVVVPLYYSGLQKSCKVIDEHGNSRAMKLDDEWKVALRVKVGPRSCTWFEFQ
jgi:hypothetical protein